jgi:hypothetical protein
MRSWGASLNDAGPNNLQYFRRLWHVLYASLEWKRCKSRHACILEWCGAEAHLMNDAGLRRILWTMRGWGASYERCGAEAHLLYDAGLKRILWAMQGWSASMQVRLYSASVVWCRRIREWYGLIS